MKQSFLEFCKGYAFYNKNTKQQIYKYELYWGGYTLSDCWNKFEVVNI